jgi:hypothetical protein
LTWCFDAHSRREAEVAPSLSRPATARRRATATVHAVYVRDTVEVFDNLDAAARYAAQDPAALVRSYPLRRSIDEATVVHDRRVVIRAGRPGIAEQVEVLAFYDDEFQPPAADVEVFELEPGEWHVVGFGTDENALTSAMDRAIERIWTGRIHDSVTTFPLPAHWVSMARPDRADQPE